MDDVAVDQRVEVAAEHDHPPGRSDRVGDCGWFGEALDVLLAVAQLEWV
jgi:hypothetical protein